nr:fructosamine kinase family protein [Oleiagrimonas sp. C23AA]
MHSALPPTPLTPGLQHVLLEDGRHAVIKHRPNAPPGFFDSEANGLRTLAESGGLRVPDLWYADQRTLVMEDLGQGRQGTDFYPRAGTGLARQHKHIGPGFGFDHDGWCGDSPQANTWHQDGHQFFAECRLLPQARQALDGGQLSRSSVQRIETLCARLSQWIPTQPAVLLHGDLWSGNLHCTREGEPALIDAGAVHYGWAEAELAMLTLFGAPPEAFFSAYAESGALAADWRERAPLYNLYHLLNHLNLFGASYSDAVHHAMEPFV